MLRALVALALLVFVGVSTPTPTMAATTDLNQRSYSIAKPVTPLVARQEPSVTAGKVMTVSVRQPITGSPTRLLVRDTQTDATGQQWLRVLLPGRGTGTWKTGGRSGWVQRDRVLLSQTPYALYLNRATRTVTVRRAAKVLRRYRVVVGAPRTPTPAGIFQVTEVVRQPRGTATGPYVLATNAYSGVLMQFAGGPGQVGLHGRTGLRADPLGSAKSHGCVRFDDRAIVALARMVPVGTPFIVE